jgi:hypothetical protein
MLPSKIEFSISFKTPMKYYKTMYKQKNKTTNKPYIGFNQEG